jgi:hypothetical protein
MEEGEESEETETFEGESTEATNDLEVDESTREPTANDVGSGDESEVKSETKGALDDEEIQDEFGDKDGDNTDLDLTLGDSEDLEIGASSDVVSVGAEDKNELVDDSLSTDEPVWNKNDDNYFDEDEEDNDDLSEEFSNSKYETDDYNSNEYKSDEEYFAQNDDKTFNANDVVSETKPTYFNNDDNCWDCDSRSFAGPIFLALVVATALFLFWKKCSNSDTVRVGYRPVPGAAKPKTHTK